VNSSGLSDTEKEPLRKAGNTSDLLRMLKELAEPSPQQEALLKELTEGWPQNGVQLTVRAYLTQHLPKFV